MNEGLFECNFFFVNGSEYFFEIYDRVVSDFDGYEEDATSLQFKDNSTHHSVNIDRFSIIKEGYHAFYNFRNGKEMISIWRYAESVMVTHTLPKNELISDGTILLFKNLLLSNKFQYIVCGYELALTVSNFLDSLNTLEISPNYYPIYIFINQNDNFIVKKIICMPKGILHDELNDWAERYVEKMGLLVVMPT